MSTILRRTSRRGTAGCLLATLLLGCAPPQVAEVTGRVLSAEQPLDDVVVTFVPESAELERYKSSAVTDEAGTFRLRCVDGRSGAILGRHRVTVEDLRPYRAPRGDNAQRGADEKFASRVARSYNSVASTPLIIEVAPENAEFTLEVQP